MDFYRKKLIDISIFFFNIVNESYSKIYESDNDDLDPKKFKFSFAILLFQFFFSALLAQSINKITNSHCQVPSIEQGRQGLFNVISMLMSNSALQYISFPIQALFKSCKVLSVLLVGLVFGKFRYTLMQYMSGVIVTAGILGFNLFGKAKKSHGDEQDTSFLGIILLVSSLFSDGILADRQNITRKQYNPTSFQLMGYTSLYGSIFTFLYSIVTNQFVEFIIFCQNYNAVIYDLLIVSLLGTLGQIFVYLTINNFGPIILSLVTTTRKFFTVIFSILFYKHDVDSNQWVCFAIVFIGVGLELYDGYFEKKKAHHTVTESGKPVQQEDNETVIELKSQPQELDDKNN